MLAKQSRQLSSLVLTGFHGGFATPAAELRGDLGMKANGWVNWSELATLLSSTGDRFAEQIHGFKGFGLARPANVYA
jgi:hypothetical protein